MKIVIITGASTGIGHAAAKRMAEKGFQVFAGVRKDADAKKWADTNNVTPFLIDVTSDESVEKAAKGLQPELSRASQVHLVNNAGIAVAGPVEAVPLSRWRDQFDVNVLGLVRASQAFLPFIRATKGRIVNISSVAGRATSPYMGPYSASKFAVEAISDALRRELSQFGCRVVAIEPGPIATPIWEKNLSKKEDIWKGVAPHLVEVYGHAVDKFLKSVEKTAAGAVPVSRVSDAIEKALTCENPRTRYVVGAKALPALIKVAGMLPDKWLDSLMAKGMK